MARILKSLHLIDWDFPTRSSRVLMHDVCWYPARFIPAIPAHLIEALSSPDETILDPFCGSGTTVVEALLLGRRAVGFDVNPFAIHIAKAKCLIASNPLILESSELKLLLGEVIIWSHTADAVQSNSPGPTVKGRTISRPADVQPAQADLFRRQPSERTRLQHLNRAGVNRDANMDWYHSVTLGQLEHLFCLITAVRNHSLRHILETLFIAILMPASGHRSGKPYGYFADNVIPKQKLYRNALKLFYTKLVRLVARCASLRTEYAPSKLQGYELRVADASDKSAWRDQTFHCVVTSPPYPSAVDYTNAFRLASYWFPRLGQLDDIRALEIGARSFRKRLDAKDLYFDRMHRVFSNVAEHLAPGGSLAVVLPKGRVQSPTIHRILRDVLAFPQLTQVATLERRILNRYFVRKGGGIRTEVVTVFRKDRG